MDTYHTYFIVKYHRKTLKLRKARGLPPLEDENDLPNDAALNRDLELAGRGEDAVLTDEEQALLLKHQEALHKSHSEPLPVHAEGTCVPQLADTRKQPTTDRTRLRPTMPSQ